MKLRPARRGFSRTIHDIIEDHGPMSRSAIDRELKKIGKSASNKQLQTCLKNMRHRGWLEYSSKDFKKYDITSRILRTQRDGQHQMLNNEGKVYLNDLPNPPVASPTKSVKKTRLSLPVQVIGMICLTAAISAASTALAIRMF